MWLEATASVFLIKTGFGAGSGWLLERGLILTNEHVVEGAKIVVVYQELDPAFDATVIAVDTERDIALLRFDPDTAQLSDFATPLQTGQIEASDSASPLMALGYSGSAVKSDGTVGSASANVGVLSQVTRIGDTRELKIDAPVDPGDSGGPVLNLRGEVVGMVRAAQEQTAGGQRVVGTFFAVHIDEIRDALPGLKRSGGFAPTPTPIPAILEALVTRVIDGDTIEVEFHDGSEDTVRLLGIDTPETFQPNQAGEYGNITDTGCLDEWGDLVTEVVTGLLEGKSVRLVRDLEAGLRVPLVEC